jgi:glycosyltransferase involved in cell wall biosynthesis
MLAPIAWRTPPEHYGPWESIASLLTEGLVARGVDVTLFATLDSVTAAALDGVCPHGYAEDAQLDGRVWEALHVSHALARSGEFELVHNHLDWLPLAFGEHARAPMVTTIHGFSGAGILPAYTRSRSAFVAISDSDRYAGLDYAATIHHGIDLRMLPYRDRRGDYLVSLGRIHPDKGTADAIEIARRAGRRLVICRLRTSTGRWGRSRPAHPGRGTAAESSNSHDARRVIEVEQECTDDVDPHRADAMGEHEPAPFGLDRRPAVADLQHLPRADGSCTTTGRSQT